MMAKTQQEIVRQGYQSLVNSLGVTDALRFIQHFSPGCGDYTQERHTQLGDAPLEDILTEMRQYPTPTPNQYDEIIE